MVIDTLLLDVGNSHTKWVWISSQADYWQRPVLSHQLDTLLLPHAIPTSDVAKLAPYLAPNGANHTIRQIVVSHVASAQTWARINPQLQQCFPHCPIHIVQAQPHFLGLTNLYTQAKQLGSDRWCALLAASQPHLALRTQNAEPCATLVATWGTATTLDALLPQPNDKAGYDFIGGVILPGFETMRHALRQGTAQLPLAEGSVVPFARNTDDAIISGCIAAQLGAFVLQYDRLAKQVQHTPLCLLSGGGAARAAAPLAQALSQHLPARVEPITVWVHPNLVLEGLFCVAKAGIIDH